MGSIGKIERSKRCITQCSVSNIMNCKISIVGYKVTITPSANVDGRTGKVLTNQQ